MEHFAKNSPKKAVISWKQRLHGEAALSFHEMGFRTMLLHLLLVTYTDLNL